MAKKTKKIKLLTEHVASLNHWRNEFLESEKIYYKKNFEKEKLIKNMINKYLDEVLDYNKNKLDT